MSPTNSGAAKPSKSTQHENTLICILAGEDHLVTECAEILIKNNSFFILGLISPSIQAKKWAQKHNVLFYETFKEANEVICNTKVDYFLASLIAK